MSTPEEGSSGQETPLNSQIVATVEAARQALEKSAGQDGEHIVRLQVAHSMSLALADATAQIRRLQTLAVAGQAAAQRAILDGGDVEAAERAADLGHSAVGQATRETLELAQAISRLADPASTKS